VLPRLLKSGMESKLVFPMVLKSASHGTKIFQGYLNLLLMESKLVFPMVLKSASHGIKICVDLNYSCIG
jgi:hypothetical protein